MKNLLQSFVINHPMVEEARTVEFERDWKNKLYLVGIALFVMLVVLVGTLIILAPLSFPLNAILNSDALQTWLEANPIWDELLLLAIPLIFGFGGIYLVMAFFTKRVEKRPFKSLGFVSHKKGLKIVRGFVLGIASSAIIFLLTLLLTPSTLSVEGALVSGVAAIPVVLLLMIPWAIQATAEEVVFQGWLVPHLTKRHGVIIAIAFSAILFAVIHLMNPNMSFLVFSNLALYGLFAALYMLYEKSLYGIAAYHFAWNWSLGQLFGATMFEGEPVISIFGLNRDGHAWLTGGPRGSDGTIFETILLVLLIGGVLMLQHRRMKGSNHA